MTEQDVIDYLELIATQIKDIRHTVDGKKKFGYYEDLETKINQFSIREFCLLAYKTVIQPRTSENGREQYFTTLPVQFEVSKAIPNQESFFEIKQAQRDAYAILLKIWRRILYDERSRKYIFSVGKVRLEGVFTYDDVEAGYENLCGKNLKFSLKWQIEGIDDDYDLNQDFVI
jgi:hypothetical protein